MYKNIFVVIDSDSESDAILVTWCPGIVYDIAAQNFNIFDVNKNYVTALPQTNHQKRWSLSMLFVRWLVRVGLFWSISTLYWEFLMR